MEKPDLKPVGGMLEPYTNLDVGDSVVGILEGCREKRQPKGKGKNSGVDLKVDLILVVQEETELSRGRVKEAKRVTVKPGEKIAVTVGGTMSHALKDAVMKTTGASLGEDEEFGAEFLTPLRGKWLQITRHEDREIKSGRWEGKMSKQYEVLCNV